MTIFCVLQNYFSHRRQIIDHIPVAPTIFKKQANALCATDSGFQFTPGAGAVYGGCELVLRISTSGKDIKEEEAMKYCNAITTGINCTTLAPGENPRNESHWKQTSGWKNSSATGNWIHMNHSIDQNDINFCLYRNRALQQLANSSLMINSFNKIISIISRNFPMYAGDLIFTGAPPELNLFSKGDKLEAFIEDDSLLETGIL
jgi:2-keto-4-pentenoate hydratase/2-oxohepta-3-ene-1,7-dioic acid hydratase in catechol pathway